ncbi:MAG: MOSC N-terminal beta barrel domain-containing protein [Acidobacteriota bacterium]
MWVKEIWRYPVKSMAGEQLQAADLTRDGILGDRLIQTRHPSGRTLTARTRPLLLRHHATTSPANLVLVDGRPWDSPEVAPDVEAAAGPGARLVHTDPEERFDVLPLLVMTDGALAAVGFDSRRFRPNLIIGGVPGLAERQWEGASLRIGNVTIGMQDLRARCIMTTFDPDTGQQNLDVLRRVQREFDGVLGLNSSVISPGRISVGDIVELVPAP